MAILNRMKPATAIWLFSIELSCSTLAGSRMPGPFHLQEESSNFVVPASSLSFVFPLEQWVCPVEIFFSPTRPSSPKCNVRCSCRVNLALTDQGWRRSQRNLVPAPGLFATASFVSLPCPRRVPPSTSHARTQFWYSPARGHECPV